MFQNIQRGLLLSMTSYPYIHSYAKYFLKKNNLRIKNSKGKVLFNYPPLPENPPKYFLYEFNNPILKVGSFEKSESVKEISYQDLKDYGFIINSYKINPNQREYSGQAKTYQIRKDEFVGENTLKRIPDNHTILFDTINRAFCLQGRTSDNKWVYISKPKTKEKELSVIENIDLMMGLKPKENLTIGRKDIEGIPIGISYEDWKLVCIPPWKNPPVIGFVGKRGKSKSIGLHMMNDFLFNMGHCCCLLNDWKYETGTWNLPTEGADFINRLNKLNIKPKPLPTVYFIPDTRIKEKNLIGREEGIGHIISLSFKNIIRSYNEFFSSFKEFDLGQSRKHFNEKLIENCKKPEEVFDIINTIGDEKHLRGVRDKLRKTMEFLFDQNICDISTNTPPTFQVEKLVDDKVINKTEKLHPIIASMIAGLFPVFLPRKLLTIKFGKSSVLPSYMNNIVQAIYDIKDGTNYFEKKEVYISIDELNTITAKGVNQAIIDVANLGRTSGIGMLWATQNYSKALEDVRLNTEFLFCMQYDSSSEINAICGNYDAKDYVKDEIKQLSKEIPHECFVFPSSPLLAYDLSTGEKEYIDEPIKIQLTPPLSKHAVRGLMG